MARISLHLSKRTDKTTNMREIMMRFYHGKINQRCGTHIWVPAELWDERKQELTLPKWRNMTPERKKTKRELAMLTSSLSDVKSRVLKAFYKTPLEDVEPGWLRHVLASNRPAESKSATVVAIMEEYIGQAGFSQSRAMHFKSLRRTLMRYEAHTCRRLTLAKFSAGDIDSIEDFLRNEHILAQDPKYSKILAAVPGSRVPKKRGNNAVICLMRMLRSFFLWATKHGHASNNPFKTRPIENSVYGTPFFLTIEERNHLYSHNFSATPKLATQRDIFIFQCMVGMRVGDLYRLTSDNIVDGTLEYVPAKTAGRCPTTLRVPLNAIALEILQRHARPAPMSLFPFSSRHKYNSDIKAVIRQAGINRMVSVINPTTSVTELRPICDVATSHMARRCFIGNLYKKIKDPNLIGKLTGHTEGSRAFSRYRDIDEDTCRELVEMLE